MEVLYNNVPIKYNNKLHIQYTQSQPVVNLYIDNTPTYMLIMYDPDAVEGCYIHWIVTDIINNIFNNGNTQLTYVGPAPPNSPKHRYIFELYVQQLTVIPTPITDRAMSIEQVREYYGLTVPPIIIKQFIAQNESGLGD